MKRMIAVMMAVMMLFAGIASALAEQDNTPPAMPDGQGFPGGTPPEMPADGSFPEFPEGMSFPEGQTPPGDFDFCSFPGGSFPGGGISSSGGVAAEGQLGSWSMGGQKADSAEGADYAYDAAPYVTADGIDAEKSATGRINGGSYDGAAASGITVEDAESGHNGVLVVDTEYTVSDATINLITDADGTNTCDSSGKGAAVAVFGKGAKVTIENSTVHTAGEAATPIFADSGATVTVRSSTLQSDGGTLYSEYMNTPAQNLMVAPPWILGIMGTSRASNMMGDKTTVNVIDSETSAGAWAVLSTDTGTDMTLNVYNSSLTLNNADESQHPLQAEGGQISETLDNPYTENYGSGYGSFVIGNASETFAGAVISAGTYATIFNGGSAVYTALEAGKTYTDCVIE